MKDAPGLFSEMTLKNRSKPREKLSHVFHYLQPFRALVLGDLMLDTYTAGRVRRISPEAPVPVLEVESQEARAGGAGNVVLNLRALGGEVIVVGRIGSDVQGESLKESLTLSGVDLRGLVSEMGYRTPVKNRIIANSQQLLRVDQETIVPLSPLLEEELIERLRRVIAEVQVIAISDYGKGFLTPKLLSSVLQIAKEAKVPALVDPKGNDFTKYRGAALLKPNLGEAYTAAKLPFQSSLEEVSRALFASCSPELLLITRSEAGMTLFHREGGRSDFPVRSREVKDVTGAGDTVLATLCLACASGLSIEYGAELANLAAGVAIEKVGCAQVTLSEIAERLLSFDSETKIFDENQSYALCQVLKGKRYALLVLKAAQEVNLSLFRVIRKLGSRESIDLVVYVAGSAPHDELIHHLSSLDEVDYVIFQEESLKSLCGAIDPAEVYTLEGKEERAAKELLQSLLADIKMRSMC